MKKIPLTQGKQAIVDDEDYGRLKQYKWHCLKQPVNFYAVRSKKKGRNQTQLRMHRLIMGAPVGMDVDHRNHDGLDNRKCNLRLCTRQQNHRNRRKRKKCSSIYKGVCWDKVCNKWKSYIMKSYKSHHIGYFGAEFDAAKSYDAKAKELFGEFAKLNFPEKGAK